MSTGAVVVFWSLILNASTHPLGGWRSSDGVIFYDTPDEAVHQCVFLWESTRLAVMVPVASH